MNATYEGIRKHKFSKILLMFHTSLYFRGRRFYGKPVIKGVQCRSETIYMPHHMNHAVYNLDQTVAVGDNPFYNTAIEESALRLFEDGQNGYSYIKDFRVHLSQGALLVSKLLK